MENETVQDSLDSWREDNFELVQKYPDEDELGPKLDLESLKKNS